jgi:hypothetical protein
MIILLVQTDEHLKLLFYKKFNLEMYKIKCFQSIVVTVNVSPWMWAHGFSVIPQKITF